MERRPKIFSLKNFYLHSVGWGLISLLTSSAWAKEPGRLKLATTTSTENSGLLAYLLPDFEKRFDLKVDVIAVGTGKALKLAENGDADLVLVHAPELEAALVQAGFGVNRRAVMKNEFVIVGPPADPARVKGSSDAAKAMSQIKQSGAVFVSRGDYSGTHQKEKALWALVQGQPEKNYLEAGQGMEAALFMANEKQAYTLTDRGTYLAVMDKLNLLILFEHDPMLDNPYSVIAVNPGRHPHVNYLDAMLFIAWLTSPETQARIETFQKHGQALFRPAAAPQPAPE